MQATAHLRVARATDRLKEVVRFYRDALGFEVLGAFEDHDGFDGVMLGRRGAAYHLEFTQQRGHPAGRAANDEDLLVFYLPDRSDWEQATRRMAEHGCARVAAANPYWDRNGVTFADPDGYRVVLQNGAWPP
jgi:catechol 2,3-dioxygenase-like lactoylglutathione lyase family enzyme